MNRTCRNIGLTPPWQCIVITATLLSAAPGLASGTAFHGYRLVQTFELPGGAGPFDVLGDGRIITLVLDEVYAETEPGSRVFGLHGFLPEANLPSYGAAFIRVSPDGTKIAVGNNGGNEGLPTDYEVGVFDVESLAGTWFDADHFDAAWMDDTNLALTTGDFIDPSVVTALYINSPDPPNPTNPIIVANIGGASGGIAFDEAGNLYTGNGYSFIGPSGTGATMAIAHAAWTAALSGGPVPDFEIDGTLVVDVLSASPLGFDAEGNLFAGGGDLYGSGESDFLALVRSSTVATALMGMGPADPSDPGAVRELDPDATNDFNFYSAAYNPISGELYVRDYGDATMYVYVDVSAVPAMSTWGAVTMTLLLVTAATVLLHRRQYA